MGVKIENLTDKPLWSRLNSGESVAIPPHMLSRNLPDHEVANNPKLKKLIEMGAIAFHEVGEHPSAGEAKSEKEKTRRSS